MMKQLTFPRVMMVSDSPITPSNPGKQRVVWAYNPRFSYRFFTYSPDIKTLKDVENIPVEVPNRWQGGASSYFAYAQDPQFSIELTLEEVADTLGISLNEIADKLDIPINLIRISIKITK